MPEKQITVNREHKSTLFALVFSNARDAFSLYNAMNGTAYDDPNELEFNTLENAVYMGMKNDISFLCRADMNLYEAQSTWNPNMPLRGVFYLSALYKAYVAEHGLDIYSSARLTLPAPRYVVFYNGTKEQPDRQELRLSDSFAKDGEMLRNTGTASRLRGESNHTDRRDSHSVPAGTADIEHYAANGAGPENSPAAAADIEPHAANGAGPENSHAAAAGGYAPALECIAHVININHGHNRELMENCRRLAEYARLVGLIRQYRAEGMTLRAAADRAIDECIADGILADILLKNRAEVTDMILEEYNEELHIRNEKRLSREEGLIEGHEKGITDAAVKLLKAGSLPPDQIAQILGLPLETVQSLQTE